MASDLGKFQRGAPERRRAGTMRAQGTDFRHTKQRPARLGWNEANRNPGNQRLRTRCATPVEPVVTSMPLISLSPHPAIVLASGTELSVPQVSAWL